MMSKLQMKKIMKNNQKINKQIPIKINNKNYRILLNNNLTWIK